WSWDNNWTTIYGTPTNLAALIPEIRNRLEGSVLILHFARFDLAFLRRAFQAAGQPWPRPPVVDTVRLLGRLEHRRSFVRPDTRPLPRNLSQAVEAFDLPSYPAHHALHDALMTAELFLVLRERLGAHRLYQLL
ncbi:MAG: 3'-5' exonuclease, partial [Acidobacteriota bacterium]